MIFWPKGELIVLINEYNNGFLDIFFKYITFLGDGIVMAILLVILLFVNYKLTIVTAISILIQSIIVSVFKRWLFADLPRPTALLEGIDWHFVEGVDVHGSNTFPSGHTTTGFALCALLVIIFQNRSVLLSLLLFLLAFLVGFSRVYLLQHFVIDVYFGAAFGVLSVVLSLIIVDRFFSTQKLHELSKKSLLTTLSRKSV